MFWGPLTALGIMGAAYLARCLEVLTAPGTGLQFVVEGRGGPVTVRTGPYTVSWPAGWIHARDVVVVSPTQLPVAEAGRVNIRVPDFFGGPRRLLEVQLKDVEATLLRDGQGKLSFLDLLPPESDEPSTLAYAVRIENARITLIDRLGGKVWVETLRVPVAKVDGAGPNWAASASLFQSEGGSIHVRARRNEEAKMLLMDASLGGLEGSRYLGPLRRSPEAKEWGLPPDLGAGQLIVRGKAHLRLPDEGEAQLDALLDLRAERAVFGEYRASTLEGRARFDGQGAVGWLEARQGGVWARFGGQASWQDGFASFGRLEATAASHAELPSVLRKGIPDSVRFHRARFDGGLSVDPRIGPIAQGKLTAGEAFWGRHRVESLEGLVRASRDRVAIRQASGDYRGAKIQGAGDLQVESGALFFAASSDPFRMERFHAELGTDRIKGPVQVSALASGKLEAPEVEIRATGLVSAEIETGRDTEFGAFSGLAHFSNDVLTVDRLDVVGPAGVVSAIGTFRLSDQALRARLVGTGLDLARLHSRLQGTATGELELRGTPREFLATGPVEAYGLVVEDQQIPLAGAHLEVTQDRLRAKDIVASKGAGRAKGDFKWVFASGALEGTFSAQSVQLQDFVADGVEGSVEVANGRLSGTVEQPILAMEARGKDLLVQGVRVDLAVAEASIAAPTINLVRLRADAGAGYVEARGDYDWRGRAGRLTGSANGLPIDRLHALLPPALSLEGRVRGSFSADIVDGQVARAAADGGLADIGLNGAFFGSGSFQIAATGSLWTGEAEIGSPERYVQLEKISYNQESDLVEARITGYSLPIEDIYRAVRPFAIPEPGQPDPRFRLSPELEEQFERIKGALDLSVQLSGPVSNPNATIQSLALRDLQVDGEPAGTIVGTGSRIGETWKVENIKWTGGPATLDARGSVVENGNISLDGNLYNLDTGWLARFIPGFARLTGEATVFFTVSGPTRSPQIEASLAGSLFEAGQSTGSTDSDKELKLDFYPILVSDGEISIAGLFNYRGFSGDVKGSIPFRYPFAFPEDREIDVSVRVPKRPLASMKDLVGSLDLARTEGEVWADLTVAGTPKAVRIDGSIDLEAKSIGLLNADTGLREVRAKTTFSEGRLRLDANAQSDKGGGLKAQGFLKIGSLDELFTATAEELLANRIEGSIQFDRFRIEENELPLDPKKTSLLSFSVDALTGGIRVHGSLKEPQISTFVPLAISGARGVIPSVLVESETGSAPLVSPRFNIGYVVGTRNDPAEIKASASVLNLYGSGVLKGTLEDLEATSNLTLRSGYLRLPNARINLQEGGTVKLLYDSGRFDSDLRLDVDIEGRTALSTVRFGANIERYDIFLEFRGNLLNSEEQSITARSDPPDLSQERIMNLLGQIDLVEQLSSQIVGTQQRSQLQQALGTIAIPVLFDPVTEALARQFGLEYLSLEYGPLAQTSILAAKWLGRGFTLQGRREISEPIDGITDYDLRLSYRPPRRIRALRGLTFSVGIDQERPWKISVEYGQRFGHRPPTGPPPIVRIGG